MSATDEFVEQVADRVVVKIRAADEAKTVSDQSASKLTRSTTSVLPPLPAALERRWRLTPFGRIRVD